MLYSRPCMRQRLGTMQVDSAKGQTRHGADTCDEWERAVSKIGRDFLIKEVRL